MSATLCSLATCLFLLLSVLHGGIGNEQNVLPAICHSICEKNIKETKTGVFCSTGGGKEIRGRCCVNTTGANSVLGIDLQQCNIAEEDFIHGIEYMSDLLYISLEGNNVSKFAPEDFNRNTRIIYLSLPYNVSCPGGSEAWNETRQGPEGTVCLGEQDICLLYNVSCPENSECKPAGVGLTECLCKEGFHGYKCMNEGTFPVLEFVLGITIPTAVISVLLWVTQRRYVKTVNKKK